MFQTSITYSVIIALIKTSFPKQIIITLYNFIYFFNILGNFNGTNIHLSNNDLSDFDEAVFKPLMADSTARIEIETSKIS